MNGCEFLSEIRNATLTTSALKLMHRILEEHLECLSEGGEGTEWGNHLYEDMKELAAPHDVPNPILCVFLHHELMDTLKDWTKTMIASEHVEYNNQLEETFAIESIKEKP
tara:strand:+ start:19328 stop:19657 length:330 start_codon:yes stop_codon:yes gene_type:complete